MCCCPHSNVVGIPQDLIADQRSDLNPASDHKGAMHISLSFSVFASYPTNILIREKRSQQSFVFSDLLCTAEYHPQRAGLDWPECKFCPLCTSIYCPFLPWTKFQPHFSWFFFIPLTAFFPVLIAKNVWADMWRKFERK